MRAIITWWAALFFGLIFQTTVFAGLLTPAWMPDFSTGLVLWLALTGMPRGGSWYAFCAGAAVDIVGGSPFGLIAACRLVQYGMLRPFRGVFEESPLVLLLGPLAVVLETLCIVVLTPLAFQNSVDISEILLVGLRQLIVQTVAVPCVFLCMEFATGYRAEKKRLA